MIGKSKAKTLLQVLVIAMLSPSASIFAQSRTGQFAGYYEINEKIRVRLFEPSPRINIGSYIADSGLTRLLGFWERSAGSSTFKNGTPNALNSALWKIIAESFATDISSTCTQPNFKPMGTSLRLEFRDELMELCKWPLVENLPDHMEKLWNIVMGFDAPYDEMLAWKEYFLSDDHPIWDGPEGVRQLIRSMLFSSDFLLSK